MEFREIRIGIYFLCKDQQVVYVGQSCDIPRRIYQHTGSKDFDAVLAMLIPSHLLDEAERYWIERIKPRLNAGYAVEPEKKKLEGLIKESPTYAKESPMYAVEWGDSDYVERKFGIGKRLLNALADENRISARRDEDVYLFNIQSVRDLIESSPSGL